MNTKLYRSREINELDCKSWIDTTDSICEKLIKKGRDESLVLELFARTMPNGMLEFLDQKILAGELEINQYSPVGKILLALEDVEYVDLSA